MTEGGVTFHARCAHSVCLRESSNGRVAPRFYIRGLGNTDFDLPRLNGLHHHGRHRPENVILKSFRSSTSSRLKSHAAAGLALRSRHDRWHDLFDSVRPSEETDGYMSLTVGSLNTFNWKVLLAAIIDDVLMGRISVMTQNRGAGSTTHYQTFPTPAGGT